MRKVVIAVVTCALALTAILVLLLATLDIGRYRGLIEAQASQAVGRDVKLAGAMGFDLALHPTLVAEQVSVANPSWASRPLLATFERVEATIGLLPLLARRVEIDRLALDGADIGLERAADGRPNWQLTAAAPTTGVSQARTEFGSQATWRWGTSERVADHRRFLDPVRPGSADPQQPYRLSRCRERHRPRITARRGAHRRERCQLAGGDRPCRRARRQAHELEGRGGGLGGADGRHRALSCRSACQSVGARHRGQRGCRLARRRRAGFAGDRFRGRFGGRADGARALPDARRAARGQRAVARRRPATGHRGAAGDRGSPR